MTTEELTLARAKEEADRRQYEENAIGMRDTDGSGMTYTIASLRKAFEKYHHTDGTDWKRPVDVTIPAESEMLVCFTRAIEFFQGVRPTVHAVQGGRFGALRITSPGYVC
jgi:hypothetical protein